MVAIGAFAGIRNVAAHTTEEWSEQVALELLALLSTVARWAEDTEHVVGVKDYASTPSDPLSSTSAKSRCEQVTVPQRADHDAVA
jgi:hypothetical protein